MLCEGTEVDRVAVEFLGNRDVIYVHKQNLKGQRDVPVCGAAAASWNILQLKETEDLGNTFVYTHFI